MPEAIYFKGLADLRCGTDCAGRMSWTLGRLGYHGFEGMAVGQ